MDNITFSDYWLKHSFVEKYLPQHGGEEFTLDIIQLASIRRVISNFVHILTNKSIPVQFVPDVDSSKSFTDGKTIWLSASVKRKDDFDWSVGLALHEAAHILLTEFEIANQLHIIPITIPSYLKEKTEQKSMSNEQIVYLCKWVFNYVEDRYIDSYVFNEAPGYRGYYMALYDRFWNNEEISEAIKSDDYRTPTMESYEFRVINLTNPNTDLNALAGLKEICEQIDISNILRLDTTKKRINCAFKVVGIIIDNLDKGQFKSEKESAQQTIDKIHQTIEDFQKDRKRKVISKGESQPDKKQSELEKAIDKQKKFLVHDYTDIKEKIDKDDQSLLESIEKFGISVTPTNLDSDFPYPIDCILVNKLTKELLHAGKTIFPYNVRGNIFHDENDQAIQRGFQLGRMLGRKLQIRAETNVTKYIRKHSGKIEKRLLSDIGAGLENIFYRNITQQYRKAKLHISVDASSSMTDKEKWLPTMTCVTAICVAASMVQGLNVSVSFRSTHSLSVGVILPYVVMAYDSEIDKISKIRQIFPYLSPRGATPEGLIFEAIMDKFIIGKNVGESEKYFLNISDGEPYYCHKGYKKTRGSFSYNGDIAAGHTRRQIEKMRKNNITILSYFIKSNDDFNNVSPSNKLFKIMYGKDARFLDVCNINEIARTINSLFLIHN
jgi:hypothetical protein